LGGFANIKEIEVMEDKEKGKDTRILYVIIGFLLAVIVFMAGGKLREVNPFGIAKIEFPTETPIITLTPFSTSTAVLIGDPINTKSPIPVFPTATENTVVLPTSTDFPRGKYPCPLLINQSKVDLWKMGQASVPAVQQAVNEFDNLRPYNEGAFTKGTTIPSGVLVATNFDVNDGNAWTKYPVTPLIHSGSWGLFQTIGEYTAPNDGACMTIVP